LSCGGGGFLTHSKLPALSAEQTVEACLDVLTQNKLEFAPVLRSGSKTDCMGFLDMTDLVGFVVDIASAGDIENDRVSSQLLFIFFFKKNKSFLFSD
jgi:Mg2+/Co2+ transporter CorC